MKNTHSSFPVINIKISLFEYFGHAVFFYDNIQKTARITGDYSNWKNNPREVTMIYCIR